MRHLHYGEQFAVARCSFFKIYYFSLKSSRYGKKNSDSFSGILRNIQSRMARNFEANDERKRSTGQMLAHEANVDANKVNALRGV